MTTRAQGPMLRVARKSCVGGRGMLAWNVCGGQGELVDRGRESIGKTGGAIWRGRG